jgi:hypothetical protein
LNGSFSEAVKGVMKFPGCDAHTFETFIYWLFNKDLSHLRLFFNAQVTLAKMWCFGEVHLLPKLQNCAMRALIDNLDRYQVDFEALAIAKDETQLESPLGQVLVEKAATGYANEFERAERKLALESDAELLAAVARQLAMHYDARGVKRDQANKYFVEEV